MSPLRVAIVAEDIRFVGFLRPAVEALCGPRAEVVAEEKTSGCRPRVLVEKVSAQRDSSDLVLVGADASRLGAAASWRQKQRRLRALLGRPDGLVVAVAQPSVEAWLMSDLDALAAGLSAGLGPRVRRTGSIPRLRTEKQAKRVLADVVRTMADATLPMSGFEFADRIVPRMRLVDSNDVALAAWARELVRVVRDAG